MDALANEGILQRVQGKGVFVVGNKYEKVLEEHGGFVNAMSALTTDFERLAFQFCNYLIMFMSGCCFGPWFYRENVMENNIERLKKIIDTSCRMVFFGGAGVSTESGIPDFRSVDGLYNQKYDYPPETIISHTFFRTRPKEFYRFYKEKMICLTALPNPAHLKLAAWEREGKLKAVITQNIDGLHQAAGSRRVLELHGSVHRNYCERCGKFYDVDFILAAADVPACSCGGTVKPDVVLYEEGLHQDTLSEAAALIAAADVLVVGGTSLAVYPAAGLIDYYRGDKLVMINRSVTSRDRAADLLVQGNIGAIFGQI